MCGRYLLELDHESSEKLRVIVEALNRGGQAQSAEIKGGEVFPSQMAPVILAQPHGFAVRPMRWGFPRVGGKGIVINSRSEKADATPMFQRAVRERRCLIPAQCFYEWKRTDSGAKTKQKYAFTLANAKPGELMYLAGLYGAFSGGFEAGGYDGFAILTQAADAQMAPYHSRMPVILRDEALKKAWLASGHVPYQSLRERFSPPELCIAPV